MATTQVKTIIPGVQLRTGKRGKALRFCCMIQGNRFQEAYEKVPLAVLVAEGDKPTKLLKECYNEWYDSCLTRMGFGGAVVAHEPTLGELVDKYEELADARSRDPRFMSPKERTYKNYVKNFKYLVKAAGLSLEDKYWKLYDTDKLQEIFELLIGDEYEMTGTSAWTYVNVVANVAPRWAIPYFERAGLQVKVPAMPDVGRAKKPQRYKRPTSAELDKQDIFYASLAEKEDSRLFLMGSMVLQLAMRPNDAGQLTAENFFEGKDGRHYLSYTPSKTANTSGRIVTWPLPTALWEQIRKYAGERLDKGEKLIPNWKHVCNILNADMRKECDMNGSKALYEWRKRCIDYVYHHFGTNAATAISGDRAETIEYYYFDPKMDLAAPTFETIPIKTA